MRIELLRIADVMTRVGLARSTIYELMAAGEFPRPCYPSPGAPRWRSDEIAAWIDELSAKRPAAA